MEQGETQPRRGGAMRTTRTVPLGIVHHANQYLITNGYTNREGLSALLGPADAMTGYLKVLTLHSAYRVPLNLHVSGTLLEAVLWHDPEFLQVLHELHARGLLELVGSCYAQNIMRFFTDEHNTRQLDEHLRLYRDHLRIHPRAVKVFWPPERVWDTERLAPVLTDPRLLNGGYQYILIDDRLWYPIGDGKFSRRDYDRTRERRLEAFAPHQILDGRGLIALPIATLLRQNIPPFDAGSLPRIEDLLRWLAAAGGDDLIAIYGDDFEKAAGMGGWDPRGTVRYEAFLRWLGENAWIRPVKLSEWASARRPTLVRPIDVGTFFELSGPFGAGEGYEGWYFDPNWEPYRAHYAWSEGRVRALSTLGADPTLIELASKHLLASSWETAWHTPPCGVHGDPAAGGVPSPWIKALASHSRHAAVIAEAAHWMRHKDDEAHADLWDIDNDGTEELVLKNEKLFAVVSPVWGGRLLYLASVGGAHGRLVIGNPCDDWNWMEELNKYMEVPANHPGALTEIGHEHDRYQVLIEAAGGREARVRLRNIQVGSPAAALVKTLRLARGSDEIEVTYHLPDGLVAATVECGLSPDYLHLLRDGRSDFHEVRERGLWGGSANGVTVWVRLDHPLASALDRATRREFGHGRAIRFTTSSRRFTLWIGSRPGEAATETLQAPGERGASTALASPSGAPREASGVPSDVERLGSPSASRARALEILTSPEIMLNLLQERLSGVYLDRLRIRECRPKVLKERLGSRQVVSYMLLLAGETATKPAASAPVELVVKRYADAAEGARAFRTMRFLWLAGFDGSSPLNIPRPVCYLPDVNLLIQEMARGVLLPAQLGRDDAGVAPTELVARWLAKLHRLGPVAPDVPTYDADARSITTFVAQLAGRYQSLAAHLGEVAGAILEKVETCDASSFTMVHGDFHPENIFVRPNGATVIDFDVFCRSDPARDLGHFIAQTRAMAYFSTGSLDASNAALRTFLDAYHRALPPRDAESLACRIPAFTARAFLESLYYILAVLRSDRPDVLSVWLREIEHLVRAERAEELLGAPV